MVIWMILDEKVEILRRKLFQIYLLVMIATDTCEHLSSTDSGTTEDV